MPPKKGRRAGFNFTGPMAGVGNSMLGMFGISAATRDETEQEYVRSVGFAAHSIPLHVQLWIGARLPFGAFVAILGFFTYCYHIAPLLPWLLAFFSIVFAVVVCWPSKHMGAGAKPRSVADWGLMWSWFLAVGLALMLGHINYGILESWINSTFLQEYKDLKADTNPDAVMDAGILTFRNDVVLETTYSAGYKFWFYNYCAAPIVGPEPQAFPVTFWAVGVGCCASRGDFKCDSAEDKSAHSAVPLRRYNLGPEITSHYTKAINMAAAANDIDVAKEPVFVMWHKDPKKHGKDVWWLSTGLFVLLTMLAFCACCACQSGLTHMSVMQQHS